MNTSGYNDAFIEKYSDDDFLYEYKTGEFQSGEIIGMVTNNSKCDKFDYAKNTKQEYIPIVEFYSEEWYRENDLQVPTC